MQIKLLKTKVLFTFSCTGHETHILASDLMFSLQTFQIYPTYQVSGQQIQSNLKSILTFIYMGVNSTDFM